MVTALENEGVGYIFAIPGEENLDVLESLRRSKIKLVLTRPMAPASARPSELSTMPEAAFEEGGVHLIVVPVDYSENMRVLVNALHPVVQAN